ncbi:MAG: hypothetical protein H0W70_13845 [Actinobacteria bacterium]|nr:hypothetical protein [Actinomycetota bacterium]
MASVPFELLDAVGAVGALPYVRERIAAYRAAGVDDVAIVPATPIDLRALAS